MPECKKRALNNIICADFLNTDFKADTISAAGLFDVMEHIENDISFLRSINYILLTGGYLFITVPAYNFLWSKEDTLACHFRRLQYEN